MWTLENKDTCIIHLLMYVCMYVYMYVCMVGTIHRKANKIFVPVHENVAKADEIFILG